MALLKAQGHDLSPDDRLCCCNSLWAWLYRRFICGIASPANAYEKQLKHVDALHKRLETQEEKGLQLTGAAIVVFNYERHAKQMLYDHERVSGFLRGLVTPSFARSFHRQTGVCTCMHTG